MKFSHLASLGLLVLSSCSTTPPAGTSSVPASLAQIETLTRKGLDSDLARRDYAAATARIIAAWQVQTGDHPTTETWVIKDGAQTWHIQPTWPRDLSFDRLIPVTHAKDRMLNRVVSRDGVGTPYVARWDYTEERKKTNPFMTDSGYLRPVTATIEPRSTRSGIHTLSLRVHDPRAEKTVKLAGDTQPLAADFSAVGELIMASAKKGMVMPGLGALRNSKKYLNKLGLITLEPPAANRIPVIFIHGLMSRPLTWHNAFNELGSDPEILKNYQLYFFRYPSGVPVVYSAARFREQLALLHQELARIGNHRAAGNMVLIGHSMGGLVSKLQVQSSGDRLWINVFGAPPDKLGFKPDVIAAFKQYLEFESNPHISRVIFVCTPHRGSTMAQGFVGGVGRRLVSLPSQILGDTFSILQGDLPDNPIINRLMKKGLPSSIDNLSPTSPFLMESVKIPLRPGLHIHSIIGNKDGLPLTDPKCTDGVVPYTSAHLDGVESEFVLRSKHGAHERSEAIAEMRRILLLHLKK